MVMVITITDIMNTTQTKMTSFSQTLVPKWIMVWLALVLIVLSLSPLAARFVTLSGEETRSDFLGGKKVSQESMRDYISGRERAVSWFPYSHFYNDLAMVAFDKALDEPTKRKSYLESSLYWQSEALKTSPSDPYSWFRLAYIYESMTGEKERAAKLWQQSYITAPYEPRLLLSRLGMARRLEPLLGVDAPDLILQLIRQAWDYNPWHLTRMARDDKFLALAKEALKEDPAALKRFDKILREQLN